VAPDWFVAAGPASADEAVTALYAAEYRPLVRVATLLLHDQGAAEDITQDAFVALHAAWWRLRSPDRARAYLRQSVVNRCRSALRHRGVVDRYLRRQPPPATIASAEHAVLAAAAHDEMLAAVATLPTRQREAVVLRYYADLSEAETAEVMGVSVGAVKSHTSRAMTALRARLGEAS
jgi:RNA polymerase sigma-70 factor (sigma-E family)